MKQYNNGPRKAMMYGGMSKRKPMMYGGIVKMNAIAIASRESHTA